MTPADPPPFGIDPGLWARFRDAGEKVAWRPAPHRPGAPAAGTARIAHLHDEEAREERHERGGAFTLTVDSGPVGALLLLLEAGVRGPPRRWETIEAPTAPGFPGGALRGTWSSRGPAGGPIGPRDLIELARYALA
ncbi:MAG TPA: hypothetical protein VMG36_05595 [Thermoplasmata archaeon]|nr:hypothetical protein [Thermoplasmata archaeon]